MHSGASLRPRERAQVCGRVDVDAKPRDAQHGAVGTGGAAMSGEAAASEARCDTRRWAKEQRIGPRTASIGDDDDLRVSSGGDHAPEVSRRRERKIRGDDERGVRTAAGGEPQTVRRSVAGPPSRHDGRPRAPLSDACRDRTYVGDHEHRIARPRRRGNDVVEHRERERRPVALLERRPQARLRATRIPRHDDDRDAGHRAAAMVARASAARVA